MVSVPQRKGRIHDCKLYRRFKSIFPLQHRGRPYMTLPFEELKRTQHPFYSERELRHQLRRNEAERSWYKHERDRIEHERRRAEDRSRRLRRRSRRGN